LHLLLQIRLALALALKPIEVLSVEHVKTIVLPHQDLCELLQIELAARHGQDGASIGRLEDLFHLDELALVNKTFLEDDSVGDSLHAVFDQILKHVAVGRHVEIRSFHFGDNEFDLEAAREAFSFTQLHDRLFQVVIARHGSDDNIDVLALPL